MKNTTITLEESLLQLSRKLASNLGLSFNAYIKKLLENSAQNFSKKTLADLVDLSSKIAGDSKGATWTRESIYER